MSTIFATSALHPEVDAYLRRRATLRIASRAEPAILAEESVDATVIIVRDPIPASLFESHRKLRGVVRHGTGLDMIPLDAATAAGIPVMNVPGVNAASVAEHAIMSALVLRRRLLTTVRVLRSRGWHESRATGSTGRTLAGSTIGLIGTGNIGQAIRDMLHGWDVTLIGYNRSGATPAGIHARALDDLLRTADIVVVACPLTDSTRGLLDDRQFDQMKTTAIVVNVARGPIINEDALIRALRDKHIAGAALDVYAQQPLAPDHPFFQLDDILLTPHIAGATEDSMRDIGRAAAAAALEILAGRVPTTLVNPEVLQRHPTHR